MKKKNNFIKQKIIMGIAAAIIIGLVVYLMIESSMGKSSYFSQHFLLAIVLVFTGVIALTLPTISSKTLKGDTKGDNLMFIVGFLLFICAIGAIFISYI